MYFRFSNNVLFMMNRVPNPQTTERVPQHLPQDVRVPPPLSLPLGVGGLGLPRGRRGNGFPRDPGEAQGLRIGYKFMKI
jgi:hypothetical protein